MVILRVVLVCQFLLYASLVLAQTASSKPSTAAFSSIENRRFVGPMGVIGEPNPSDDVFIFKDGKFVSQGCLNWGFSPAPYWLRQEADGLHFFAELTSPDHGQMRYQGVYDGQKIKGNVTWKKERWYWTTEREYRFTGALPEPEK
jgi:hypothetical protein